MGDRVKDQVIVDYNERVFKKFGDSVKLVSVDETGKNGERYVTVRCLKCGTEKKVSSIAFRGERGNHGHCDICYEKARAYERVLTERQEKIEKEKKKTRHRLKTKQVGFRFCECGAILAYNCSLCEDCKAKHKSEYKQQHSYKKCKELWYKAEKKRAARLKDVKSDKDATLKALYEKYNGVCYLCGEPCDWNDGKWQSGAFRVGKRYPSREHIIPLTMGGDDTWSNLRLAHVSCNAKKGAKLLGA